MKAETKLFDEWALGSIPCPMGLSCIGRPPHKEFAKQVRAEQGKNPYVTWDQWEAVHSDFASLVECITRALEAELKKRAIYPANGYKNLHVCETHHLEVLDNVDAHLIFRGIVREFKFHLCETREEFETRVHEQFETVMKTARERLLDRLNIPARSP